MATRARRKAKGDTMDWRLAVIRERHLAMKQRQVVRNLALAIVRRVSIPNTNGTRIHAVA